ncbi:hypothetical protein [Ferruginibacter sp. SUN106]|uniref:hypothetical protein n=1 Tax=Ferruginibacter sp. SUN106 TaxID=2978348 RepID=UPI003D35AD12
MRRKIIYSPLCFLCLCIMLLNCNCNNSGSEKVATSDTIGEFASSAYTVTNGNVKTTISTDTAALGRLISLKYYHPRSVKFLYSFIDNSGTADRSVPGPSDYTLQAVLYFDSATFQSIVTDYMKPDWVSPHYTKEEFNFSWLDTTVKKELLQTDSSYHGHIDLFWNEPNNPNCHTWMLHNKLLLHQFSQ